MVGDTSACVDSSPNPKSILRVMESGQTHREIHRENPPPVPVASELFFSCVCPSASDEDLMTNNGQCLSPSDDNSNQSSIADSSPVKQETSCSTSPAPEPSVASQREGSETKSDQSPDSKRGQLYKHTYTSYTHTHAHTPRVR